MANGGFLGGGWGVGGGEATLSQPSVKNTRRILSLVSFEQQL